MPAFRFGAAPPRDPQFTRREFLTTAGTVGALVATQRLLIPRALAAPHPPPPARALIHIYQPGGPSHLDTFDPKPDAPASIRGAFDSIPTAAVGVTICQHLPRLARLAQRFTLVRGITGFRDQHAAEPADNGWSTSAQRDSGGRPGVGATLAATLGRETITPLGAVPTAVDLDDWTHTGFLSHRFRPTPLAALPPAALRAADLAGVSAQVRRAYGIDAAPQNARLLQARRLVSAGARYVGLSWGFWDTHGDNFGQLAEQLPHLDRGLSALLRDLAARGEDGNVLVLMTGEFGRSPDINGGDGRDHWPDAGCAFLAGGPLRHGHAVGATDRFGGEPTRPVRLDDLFATVYAAMGIATSDLQIPDRAGVRRRVLPAARPIAALLSEQNKPTLAAGLRLG